MKKLVIATLLIGLMTLQLAVAMPSMTKDVSKAPDVEPRVRPSGGGSAAADHDGGGSNSPDCEYTITFENSLPTIVKVCEERKPKDFWQLHSFLLSGN